MVESDLYVCPKLKALLPALTPEELKQLEENIIADGRVRDPIIFWNDGKRNIVVDGMNRLGIARRTGTPYHTEPMEFDNRDQVEMWMLNNALGRRNLMKPAEIRKVRGELYNRMKRIDSAPPKGAGQNVRSNGDKAEIVAEKAGVSERTVRRDGKRREILDEFPAGFRKALDEGKIEATDKQLAELEKSGSEKIQEVAKLVRANHSLELALHKAGVIKRDLENCEHSWVEDWNGKYCEFCKVDYPPKEPPAPQPDPDAVPMDQGGKPIPKQLMATFQVRSTMGGLVKRLGAILGECETLVSQPGGQRLPMTEIKADLRNLQSAIKAGMPHAVCPYCRGKTCDKCDKLGWLHKGRYDGISEERR